MRRLVRRRQKSAVDGGVGGAGPEGPGVIIDMTTVLRRAILTCYPTVPLRLTPDYSTVAHRVLRYGSTSCVWGKVPAFATSYGITLIL